MRTILFIVGMHRSGTSALAAGLCACGATVGNNLLAPIKGINDDGFWENLDVVSLNESLLAKEGLAWYGLTGDEALDKNSSEFESFYIKAEEIVAGGFGDGAVEIVKDPRLCFTLPFWLKACERAEVEAKVCCITRNSIEVAASLQKRDGFPLVFGLWLSESYKKLNRLNVPNNSPVVDFQDFVSSPESAVELVIEKLNLRLRVDPESLNNVIRKDLKHQNIKKTCTEKNSNEPNNQSLNKILVQLAEAFVKRGESLTTLGELHQTALDTMKDRDASLGKCARKCDSLGAMHQQALNVISERDGQLSDLQLSLKNLGKQHEYAISVVEKRDRELTELSERYAALGVEHAELSKKIERVTHFWIAGRFIRKYFS